VYGRKLSKVAKIIAKSKNVEREGKTTKGTVGPVPSRGSVSSQLRKKTKEKKKKSKKREKDTTLFLP